MPFTEVRGARLYHVEAGDPAGPPVLLIAPGGMRSAHTLWRRSPWDPVARLGEYRLIGMDQRNAGASTGPISAADGWATYTADQLGLLDELGVDGFHVVGMCIGGPYALRLALAAPERVRSAVLLQPIGLEDNRDAFYELFDAWRADLEPHHPEATPEAWAAFREAMFGGDFVFGARRDEVAACRTPLLVLRGDDRYHPSSISREVARLAPNAELVEAWKEGDALEAAASRIASFLAEATP